MSMHAAAHALYPIVCVDACRRAGACPLEHARTLLRWGPLRIQLRAKSLSTSAALALLNVLVPEAAAASVRLFVNDRVDWALASGAPGVHLGQDDMPLADAHRLAPHLKLGVSTHTAAQVHAALAPAAYLGQLDYVACGPMFATSSKSDHAPIAGPALLTAALAVAGARDVVAIGGIDAKRAAELRGRALPDAGHPSALVVACISTLLAGDVHASCTEIARALVGAGSGD